MFSTVKKRRKPRFANPSNDENFLNYYHAIVFIVGFSIGILLHHLMWTEFRQFPNKSAIKYEKLVKSLNQESEEENTGWIGSGCQVIGTTYFPHPYRTKDAEPEDRIRLTTKQKTDKKSRDPIIFCLVSLPSILQNKKALTIWNTWGKLCDKLIFFALNPIGKIKGKAAKSMEIVYLSEQIKETFWRNSWPKTQGTIWLWMWNYVHKKYGNGFVDWFFKVDADAYAVIENLRYHLRRVDPAKPFFLGPTFFKTRRGVCATENPGYVFSREALHRFVIATEDNCFTKFDMKVSVWQRIFGSDEGRLMSCINDTNLHIIPPRDTLKRPLFVSKRIESAIVDSGNNSIEDEEKSGKDTGFNCCSDLLVAFMTKNFKEMYSTHYMVQQIRAAGINRDPVQGFLNRTSPKQVLELTSYPSNAIAQNSSDSSSETYTNQSNFIVFIDNSVRKNNTTSDSFHLFTSEYTTQTIKINSSMV